MHEWTLSPSFMLQEIVCPSFWKRGSQTNVSQQPLQTFLVLLLTLCQTQTSDFSSVEVQSLIKCENLESAQCSI